MNIDALNVHLEPLLPFLQRKDVSEILINKPQTVFVETSGEFEEHQIKALSSNHINRLCGLLANFNNKPFDERNPRLSGVLPDGFRVQAIRAPVVPKNETAVAIRKQTISNFTLDDFKDTFYSTANLKIEPRVFSNDNDSLSETRKISLKDFFRQCIKARKTIIVSGGTSTGKTTFLNALLKEICVSERLIILEDTREIHVFQPNSLCLTSGSSKSLSVEDEMTENLKASLRLRPDRLLLGEIRGGEAATFLEAASTGHDGSFATIHASSANLAIERLCLLAERGGLTSQSRASLRNYIRQIIDVVIQLKRTPDSQRLISEVLYLHD